MDRIIHVHPDVSAQSVFEALQNINLQMAFSWEGFGTVVVGDSDSTAAADQLISTFGAEYVEVVEVSTFVPDDWNAPGFVHRTLEANPGLGRVVASSGLGVHIA